MNFKKFNEQIPLPDTNAISQARAKLDGSAKPIGSLGLLEEALASIAGVLGTPDFSLEKKSLLLLIADNGVLAQGVAQTPAQVTLAMAKVIASGRSAACLMAKQAKIDVCPVDMGMFREADCPEILNRRIAAGTRDMALGPAMSRVEAQHAIEIGIELAHQKKEEGYQLLLTGEMGIGNTTSATAIACALLGLDVACATGRGAGLSDEGLLRKREVISRALKKNAPDPKDALDVLSKLGGFDLAGLCGVFLGGAFYRVPVLIDGFPSSVAALVAQRLCPAAAYAMLPGHASAEPCAKSVIESLGKRPLITAQMRLGEGTGAICMAQLLDLALAVYRGLPAFNELQIEEYSEQEVHRT